MTSNNLQNYTQKTKDPATGTPTKVFALTTSHQHKFKN